MYHIAIETGTRRGFTTYLLPYSGSTQKENATKKFVDRTVAVAGNGESSISEENCREAAPKGFILEFRDVPYGASKLTRLVELANAFRCSTTGQYPLG